MVFGREEERARLEELLDCGRSSLSSLALEGVPGIGKTTLWRAALADARQRGFRVVTTMLAEPDAALAFAGLGDLFDDSSSWPLNAVLRASGRASPAPAPTLTHTDAVGVSRPPPERSSA